MAGADSRDDVSESHPSAATARQATTAFARLLADAGVLAGSVSPDCGEDLIVPAHLAAGADVFPLRLQIRYRPSGRTNDGNEVHVRLSKDHLWRFVGHLDPVLLGIFDDAALFLVDPKQKWSLWQLAGDERSQIPLVLAEGDRATPETARRLVWQARLQQHSVMLAAAENAFQHTPEPHRDTRDVTGISLAFLRDIGVLRDEGMDPAFIEYVRASAQHLSRKYPDLTLRHAVMLSLLGCVQDESGSGLPRNLLESGAEMAGHLFRTEHGAEWEGLAALFSRGWEPFGIAAA